MKHSDCEMKPSSSQSPLNTDRESDSQRSLWALTYSRLLYLLSLQLFFCFSKPFSYAA